LPQDLLSSQETIKPKFSQTIIDSFFKRNDKSTNLPSAFGIKSENSSLEDITDTRTNIGDSPQIPAPKIENSDSVSTTSSDLTENRRRMKNIWKGLLSKSKKPPVGETTKSVETSIQD
jgi:hypothetical protein